jgi:hypothetical protein
VSAHLANIIRPNGYHAFAPTCSCGWPTADCDREQAIDGDASRHDDRLEAIQEARCYWCPEEATRECLDRDEDGDAKTRRACDECADEMDRAEKQYRSAMARDMAFERRLDEMRGK